MTYEEALEESLTAAEAKHFINHHDGEGWYQFVADTGEKPCYTGAEVLNWLGYKGLNLII